MQTTNSKRKLPVRGESGSIWTFETREAPLDLSPLPEGFRKALQHDRARTRLMVDEWADQWLDPFVIALENVWSKSTVRQRREAEPGLITVLLSLLPTGGLTSWHVGYIAATCRDLDMGKLRFDEAGNEREWEPVEILRGIKDGGGVRAADAVADVVENYLNLNT